VNTSLLSIFLTALAASAPRAGAQNAAHLQPDAAQALVRNAQVELAKVGLVVDPLPAVRALASKDYAALFAADLDAHVRPNWFEARHRLRDAFGLASSASVAELRERTAAELAAATAVRFDRASQSLVYDGERALAPAQFERELLRQLILARREKLAPLAPAIGVEPGGRVTADAAAVQRALRAGEAEFGANAVLDARGSRPADEAAPATLDPLPRLLRDAGRAYMAQRSLLGGLESMQSGWDEAPVSTEQLLHPEKLHRDRPRPVSFPTWTEKAGVASVEYDDELGELGLLAVLVEAGVELERARLAAVGWDGDRMQILRGPGGATAQVWRLYFDRPEDVRQFAEHWRLKASGQLIARALTCDWVRADSVAFATTLGEELAAAPPRLQPSEEDRESTERAEAALASRFDNAPKLEGSLWSVPQLDFRMRVPESWTLESFNGVPHVLAPQVGKYRDNISVAEVDSSTDEDIDQLLERQTRVITKESNLELVLAEKRVVDGRQAVYLHYRGEMGAQTLEFVALMFVRNKRVVAVTTSASRETWPTLESMIEAAYATIEVGVAGGRK
jgi:hypothetical protein